MSINEVKPCATYCVWSDLQHPPLDQAVLIPLHCESHGLCVRALQRRGQDLSLNGGWNILMQCHGIECMVVSFDVEVGFTMPVAIHDVAGIVHMICFGGSMCNVAGVVCMICVVGSMCYDPPQFFSSIPIAPATATPAVHALAPAPAVQPISAQPVAPPQP